MKMKRTAGVVTVTVLALSLSAGTALAAINGTKGADLIEGTDGDETVHGLAGDDAIYGEGGKDELRGEAGNDVLYGDAGRDTLRGGLGDDVIHADDGTQDRIFCGSGTDTVVADADDRVAAGCEEVAGPDELDGGVLATFVYGFDAKGERFRTWITEPTAMRDLYQARESGSPVKISIAGRILEGTGQGDHNAPYGWHLDPRSVHVIDAAILECFAPPSYVEENFDAFVSSTGGSYCAYGLLVDLRNYTGEQTEPPAPLTP